MKSSEETVTEILNVSERLKVILDDLAKANEFESPGLIGLMQ